MEPVSARHQPRLLSRLLSKLRGVHARFSTTCSSVDKNFAVPSYAVSAESVGCGSSLSEEETDGAVSSDTHGHLGGSEDYRYSGQYLTPEQLPAFCEQLRHLVAVVRNVQAYAAVTGEYPTELERRLEREAREVQALAHEARNARDAVLRARTQRRAVRAVRTQLRRQLDTLREAEMRELESTVRVSERKLYKWWETLRDSNDSAAFEPLLDEIRSKQSALESLVRLVESRCATIARNTARRNREECVSRRRGASRRRRDPRSVPLSGESSAHAPARTPALPAVAPHVNEALSPSGAGAEAARSLGGRSPVPALELPSGGSARELGFFSTTERD